jgi:hypothetical protein
MKMRKVVSSIPANDCISSLQFASTNLTVPPLFKFCFENDHWNISAKLFKEKDKHSTFLEILLIIQIKEELIREK